MVNRSSLPCLALALALALGPAWSAYAVDRQLMSRGRSLELHISDEFDAATRRELEAWIEFTAAALEQVFGHWPQRRWQVVVHPASASGEDPVPWAMVHRERQDRVEFFVAPQATARRLKSDWTGYHEMAHLLIPYRGWGDTWFSEGLATYYQNLLRARVGVLDERGMWQAFHEGFLRGAADHAFDGSALSMVSERMREDGGYMRVYWSGAWYFLKADTRLRRQSNGRVSLDTALAKLNECCASQRLAVPDIVSRLDELNQVYVFQPLYEQLRESTSMPDVSDLFGSLGISIEGTEVRLQSHGPGAELRRQIAKARTL